MNYLAKTLALPLLALIPTSVLADWNGAYAGAAVGTVDAEADFELTTEETFSDSSTFSGFAGVQVQSGLLVYGGELAIGSAADAEIESGEVLKPYTDIKGRVGYSFGDVLAYGVAGFSLVTYDENGVDFDATGFNFGAGVDYMITENMFVGAEYLTRRMDGEYPNDDADFDLDVDTFSVRVGFNF